MDFINYGELVVRVIFLFGDGRVYGLEDERVRYSLRQMCAGLQFLGNKKASRMHTDRVQQSQAWCICCIYTEQHLPHKEPNGISYE